jgi:hypothetical protein
MVNQITGEPDDVRFPSKLWEAINQIMTRHQIIENRMETVEVGMGEYGRRHQDINVKLEKITEKLEKILTNQTEQNLRIIQNKVEIERLWAFPLKIVAVITAVGGASVIMWKFSRWLLSAEGIYKLPR